MFNLNYPGHSFAFLSAGSRRRKVRIQNYHGERLVGILHDVGSTELVILCHGFQSSRVDGPLTSSRSSNIH